MNLLQLMVNIRGDENDPNTIEITLNSGQQLKGIIVTIANDYFFFKDKTIGPIIIAMQAIATIKDRPDDIA